MPPIVNLPKTLRPYRFHGLDLQWRSGDKQALCECPFCGREEKFTVNIETGLWRCLVCGGGTDKGGGNATIFIRKLWDVSVEATPMAKYQQLANEIGLLQPETLVHWGLCRSVTTFRWLVPGYTAQRAISNLYQVGDRLYPTPTLGHAVHGLGLFDPKLSTIYICEGYKDGMVLWETLGQTREEEGKFIATSNVRISLLAGTNVIALPGCGSVGTPFLKYLPLFAGKVVNLLFDHDHEKRTCPNGHPSYSAVDHEACPECGSTKGREVAPSGLTAMQRAANLLATSQQPPDEVNYLRWESGKFGSRLPSGFDLRDLLTKPSL